MQPNFFNIPKNSIVHIIGISGIGMSAIAQLLHHYGYEVQGSDLTHNDNSKMLNQLGIKTFIGHNVSNIQNATIIIHSTAIKQDNPELIAAKNENKLIKHRSDVLIELSNFKRTISISGSHGKTTTTAMIASILDAAGLDPMVIVGGIVTTYQNNFKSGSGDWLVLEADESDGSMQNINSEIAVITNIDNEHLDYYKSIQNINNSFYQFLSKVPLNSFVVVPYNTMNITNLKCTTITHSSEIADIIAKDIKNLGTEVIFNTFITHNILQKQEFLSDISISVPGEHNVTNALIAIATTIKLGIKLEHIKSGLKKFKGVKRRFEIILNSPKVTIVDDYAHHPQEIKAALLTAKSMKKNKIIAVIQPHRFTRIRDNFEDFIEILMMYHYVIITDVYTAGENQIPGYTSYDIVNALKKRGYNNIFLENTCININKLTSSMLELEKDNILLFMGAGNITNIAHEVAKNIKLAQDIII